MSNTAIVLTYAQLEQQEQVRMNMIGKLRMVLPYPAKWYLKKNDTQLHALYGKYVGSIAKASIDADEARVAEKVRRYHAGNSGELHVVVVNKRSIRFKFVKDGKERHGIIANYRLKKFATESYGELPENHVMVVWDSGKLATYTVNHLTSFICDTATNDSRNIIMALHQITQ